MGFGHLLLLAVGVSRIANDVPAFSPPDGMRAVEFCRDFAPFLTPELFTMKRHAQPLDDFASIVSIPGSNSLSRPD